MSTRGNILIKSPAQGLSFYYEVRSSAYPEYIAPTLLEYDGTPKALIDLCVLPGQVGNFDYHYELDVSEGTLKIWDSHTYWQKVPDDWRERGWEGCYRHDYKDEYGYRNWRKHKRQPEYESNQAYRGEIKLVENDRFTRAQLKTFDEDIENFHYYMKKLRFDPTKVHTWMAACPEYYTPIYEKPYEDMAIEINSQYEDIKKLAAWRLKVAA